MNKKEINKILKLINANKGVCNAIIFSLRDAEFKYWCGQLRFLYKNDSNNPAKGHLYFLGLGNHRYTFEENKELRATAFLFMLTYSGVSL